MTPQDFPVLTGQIVEEEIQFSVDELCGVCAVERHRIVELVTEGVIECVVETRSIAEWRFAGAAVRRARMALRLQRDLGLNLAGTALALDLMERIEALERQLQR